MVSLLNRIILGATIIICGFSVAFIFMRKEFQLCKASRPQPPAQQ
jgi:hypothetical protein